MVEDIHSGTLVRPHFSFDIQLFKHEYVCIKAFDTLIGIYSSSFLPHLSRTRVDVT